VVSSFRLEDKLNDAANFKVMHLHILFMLYHPTKHEYVLQRMYKRPCPNNDIEFNTFKRNKQLRLRVLGLIDQIVKF
jgi:hypothetical protein